MKLLLLPLVVSLSCVGVRCQAWEDPLLIREVQGATTLHDDENHVIPKLDARQSALACGEYTLSAGESVVIQSKNYPSRYPNNYDCSWYFETSDDSQLSFECQDLRIRSSWQCRRDFLLVNDFVSKQKLCGTNVQSIEGMEAPIKIRFRSNRRGTARGFSCTVTASPSSATTETSTEEQTTSTRAAAATTTTQAPATTTTQASTRDCTCGVRNSATRIVGGETTQLHEYPWQVALVGKGGTRPYCGGSIISDSWILTAAHCVTSNTVSNTDIVIGEHNWNSASETSVTERKTLSQARRHSSYNSGTLDNDIALLKLSEPITFTRDNKIAPVCLPAAGNLYESVDATITGWGTLSSGGSQPLQLNEVTVPTMSNAACRATGYSNSDITSNMICAGVAQGGKDSCQGDSGGPMVTGQSSMEQIGIVSWGYGCAAANFPGVYTRVTNYISWIQNIISGSATCPRSS